MRKLRLAAALLTSPCAAAVVCHPRRKFASVAFAVASLPSSVSVFTKGKEIGESSCIGPQNNVNVDVCSEDYGPSTRQTHRAGAAESAVMTSWASWIHAALRCLCSLAEAMSSHGIAPKPMGV